MKNENTNENIDNNKVNKNKEFDINSLIEINEIKVDFFLNENEKNNYDIFYDSLTKRIIVYSNKKIKIFNRHGTHLLKEIKYEFNHRISDIALNKDINYILLYYKFPKQNSIFCINLNIYQLIGNFKNEKYENLLGMFFIESERICLICPNCIEFYEIKSIIDDDEKVLINYDKKYLINYYFNRQYSILIIEKSDNTMDLYNLSKKSNYNIVVKNFCLFNKPKKLFNFFSKSIKKINLINKNEPNEKYKGSQFYLQYLYGNLYIIYLSFENEKIYILQIENSFDINIKENNKLITIPYKHDNLSTIQFVSSYIFIYNFKRKEIIIVDINLKELKSEKNKDCNKILVNLKNIELPFFDLENLKVYIKSGVVETINSNNKKILFSINFNYENFKNNPNFTKKFFKLINLIERHNTKNFVINATKVILLKNKKNSNIYSLIQIFNKYIKKNDIIFKNYLSRNHFDNKTFILNEREILKLEQKSISIDDILIQVFKQILNNNLLKNDNDYIRIIYYILYFYIIIGNDTKKKNESFDEIFYSYIKLIKDKNKINEIFKYYHPSQKKILIELINQEKDKYLQELGLYLSIKNKLYPEVLNIIYEKFGIKTWFLFLQKYHKKLSLNINDLIKNNLLQIKNNLSKKLIISIIQSKKQIIIESNNLKKK